jgi:adenine-specific DNA methylase
MGRYGQVELLTQDYGRFRADVDRENRVYKADRVEEYLFCLDKG